MVKDRMPSSEVHCSTAAEQETEKSSRVAFILCVNGFHRLANTEGAAIIARRNAHGDACNFCRRAVKRLVRLDTNEDLKIDTTWL